MLFNKHQSPAVHEQSISSYQKILGQYSKSKPGSIEELFDRIFVEQMESKPQLLTSVGIFESLGLRNHNRYLDDYSIEDAKRQIELAKSEWILLQAFSSKSLSADQEFSRELVLWQLQQTIDGEAFLFHDYPVNQLFGVTQALSILFMSLHPLGSAEDVENYCLRLEQIPKQFDQVIERIEYQKEKGISPPRFAIAKAIESVADWLENPIEKNPFYLRLSGQSEKIRAKAKSILSKEVYPAYKKLRKYLEVYLPTITREDGVWALPSGDAYYSYLLKQHTTLDLSAEEIHKIGLKEVARIEQEIESLLKTEGIWEEGTSLGAHLQKLARDPTQFYPNTEQGRADCLQKFNEILARSRTAFGPCFSKKPKSPVEIQRVPLHEENGAPAAYYNSPTIDGSRPGVFYVNMRNLATLPKFRMETLTIHEAEPGHHFERSLSLESDAHILKKQVQNTAYIEGWALYVEKLAYEEGFYSSNLNKVGHLQDELLRAARLVVDTGIHWKRWSREKAIDYFSGVLGMHPAEAVSEIERYFVLPGQACAYKIGQLKFLELRAKAKQELGDRFDLKAFHSHMLERGVLPLSML